MPLRAETQREKAMMVLLERLQTISVLNGDEVTPTLIERKGVELPETPTCPAIYIYEGTESKTLDSGRLLCNVPILVAFLAEAHTDQLRFGGRLLENLVRAIGSDFIITDADNVAQSVDIVETSNDVIAGDVPNPIVYAELVVVAQFYHKIGDLTRNSC